MSSVRQAVSSASLQNPTWAEARPICQAETISPEPSRNKLLSFPTVEPYEAAGAMGGQKRCHWFPDATQEKINKKEVEKQNIKHINLCRWCLWPAICSCTRNFYETINSKEKNLKRNISFCFLGFRAWGASSFNKSPTLFLISSLRFTEIMTAVGPLPSGVIAK